MKEIEEELSTPQYPQLPVKYLSKYYIIIEII